MKATVAAADPSLRGSSSLSLHKPSVALAYPAFTSRRWGVFISGERGWMATRDRNRKEWVTRRFAKTLGRSSPKMVMKAVIAEHSYFQ